MPVKREHDTHSSESSPPPSSPTDQALVHHSITHNDHDDTPKLTPKKAKKVAKGNDTPSSASTSAAGSSPSKTYGMPSGANATAKGKLAFSIIEKGIDSLNKDVVHNELGFTKEQLKNLLRKDKGTLRKALLIFAETL
ncbi:hypothetical protein IAU59_000622 [Kwoniella sp. CBS 9459]